MTNDLNNEHTEPIGNGKYIIVDNIHRFGTDAFLLAGFSAPKRRENCADLGTGCGIIPLLWLSRDLCGSVTGIDISARACSLARRSAELCGYGGNFRVVEHDMRDMRGIASYGVPREGFDCVVCNPPYFIKDSGYIPPDPQRAAARSELSCTFDDVCEAAVYLLRWGGRLCVCHRPERLADVISSMRSHGIEPKRVRTVHHRPGSKPWLLLIEGKRGGACSLDMMEPLFMTGENGEDSEEMRELYGAYRVCRGTRPESAEPADGPEETDSNALYVPPAHSGGLLTLVGTPIGNLGDISPRALAALRQCDFIAAEDTRVTLHLLNRFGINKTLVSYYRHNSGDSGRRILERLKNGSHCCMVSDAGMPAISDPGEDMVKLCYENGITVTCVPGPSALNMALAISGLPTGRFTFEGFLSVKRPSRTAHIEQLRNEQRTMIFYEAPHKLHRTLSDLAEALGDRRCAIVRELTKVHEEVIRTTLAEAKNMYRDADPKGEIVLIVEGAPPPAKQTLSPEEAAELALGYMADGKMSASQAAKRAAEASGVRKSDIYRLIQDRTQ